MTPEQATQVDFDPFDPTKSASQPSRLLFVRSSSHSLAPKRPERFPDDRRWRARPQPQPGRWAYYRLVAWPADELADYHRDVEQAAFSPGSLVPGIELSPDPLLQWRAFFYRDAQYTRLGSANIQQVKILCFFRGKRLPSS